MCVNLQLFPNPRYKDLRPTAYPLPTGDHPQRAFIAVPCGKCIECSDRKRNDLFVRASYEYADCLSHGGSAYFITLTYNNKCLPMFGHHPCFNRLDVTTFLRRLRARHYKFCKKFGYEYDGIRYFVTSEYGHETHRPHYHMVLFVQRPLNVNLIPYLVRSTWHFGMVNVQHLQSNIGVRYVAKYAGKDINNIEGDFVLTKAIRNYKMSLYSQPWFKEYSQLLLTDDYNDFVKLLLDKDETFTKWYSTLRKLRQKKQFYTCSKQLGHAALSRVVSGYDVVSGASISVPSCANPYPIPQSYRASVCSKNLGWSYLSRIYGAAANLKSNLLKISAFEVAEDTSLIDWQGIFGFSRDQFFSDPDLHFRHWYSQVEYNAGICAWQLRTRFVKIDDVLLHAYVLGKNRTEGHFTMDDDIALVDEIKSWYSENYQSLLNEQNMSKLYEFFIQLPDLITLITKKFYENKIRQRRDYSAKVSRSANYL